MVWKLIYQHELKMLKSFIQTAYLIYIFILLLHNHKPTSWKVVCVNRLNESPLIVLACVLSGHKLRHLLLLYHVVCIA